MRLENWRRRSGRLTQTADADWSELAWRVGPVTDYEISWGVHVEADEAAIPDFLINTRIVGEWTRNGLVLLVQITAGGLVPHRRPRLGHAVAVTHEG
jgi:hypothetical protein